MLAVEKQELTKDTNSGQGLTSSSETLSLADSESFENIAEDIIKLDGKVGLLTDANARLERQRDKLLSEKVCMCFLTSLLNPFQTAGIFHKAAYNKVRMVQCIY